MTDNAAPTRQAVAAQNRSGKLTVTGKLKVAIDAMLYDAACRADAARAAGLTDHSLRAALRKQHVTAYFNAGLKVLRESERAKNIKRLAEIRDAADNMPAVQAIKALEQLNDVEQSKGGLTVTPGLQIVIVQAPSTGVRPVIDVTPPTREENL